MPFKTFELVADDTAATIATLASLAAADRPSEVTSFRLYSEEGNEIHATLGAARIGGSDVLRHATDPLGFPLLPGFSPVSGRDASPNFASGRHDLTATYITGKTGDRFQLWYTV